MSDPQDVEDGTEPPSKSELKRQDRELRDLGLALVDLPTGEIAALDLPEDVREAVELCRRITSHGARLRQQMYLGKLLRRVDVAPLRAALGRRGEADRRRIHREHSLEQWRERLLADEPGSWTELGQRITAAQLQQLRSLARQARAEQAAQRPPAAARQLLRCLRQALETAET